MNAIEGSLIYLLIYYCVIANAWEEPFFKTGPSDEITLELGDPVVIIMNEEIEPPIIVAIVAGYSGSAKPTAIFRLGNNMSLNLDFVMNSENEWEVVVGSKQDYEQLNMQRYFLEVQIDDKKLSVQIIIRNIFDNAPVITTNWNPCDIDELLDPAYESKCVFNVYDADGMANNEIAFEIEGNLNESQVFGYQQKIEIDGYNIEYALIVKKTLYYDQRTLYNFKTFAIDVGNNRGSINTIIEVNDMPNKDPMWINAFASARFPEKTPQEFLAKAIDGDTGINTAICYKLEYEENRDYRDIITISVESGEIHVEPINRDVLKNEIYPFEIIAYKCNNNTFSVKGEATLVVDDVNDNLPEIYLLKDRHIRMLEQTPTTLFNTTTLFIEDIDLGPHATYEVMLSKNWDAKADFSQAFYIIPSTGYQRQTFTISVADIDLIDYEDENWREPFDIEIIATEIEFPERKTSQIFKVELINWNDELPMFVQDEYVFEVYETVSKNENIGTVMAIDDDIDDAIVYYLNGRINESIAIHSESGQLSTIIDGAFDYERQTEVLFQVHARDTLQTEKNEPIHTTFTQVRIKVIDVNDEPPQLNIPREILSIRENVRNQVITDKIEAYDPDTETVLKFFIDWDESYAAKPGFSVDPDSYEGCFVIEESIESRNKVFGVLSVNSSFKHNIDYEKFEIIYLAIRVVDTNQTILPNDAAATLIVRIEDENDNPPVFVGDTLIISRVVVEEAIAGAQVGTILARDIDGPTNNIIEYTMKPLGDTPSNWLTIENDTGVIKVHSDKAIDCDDPIIYDLEYEIRLYDKANETLGITKVHIIDINNKHPNVKNFLYEEVKIYENETTGYLITTINVTDLDRDKPHNVIQYMVNYRNHPNLQKYFTIGEMSGELIINLQESKLDRDNGEDIHEIYINFEDNYQGSGVRNGNQTMVRLILLDVNDNAPEMPIKEVYEISENTAEGTYIDDKFYARDNDEPNTFNSQVLYRIMSIENVDTEESNNDIQNLFTIENYENLYCRIKTSKNMKGFSGKWKITIKATDRGDEGDSGISLSSEAAYYVNVIVFNFDSPQIIFPQNGASIGLNLDITIGESLSLIDGQQLAPFEAIDADAGIFGDVTFKLSSENGDNENFEILKLNRHQSELRIRRIEEKTYELLLTAIDGGNKSDSVGIHLSFVNITGEPYFIENTWQTDFTENIQGRNESRIIPEAIDAKNVEVNADKRFDIFYYIDDNFNANDARLFQLDKLTRNLTLKSDLDREAIANHRIKIIATNQARFPATSVSDRAILIVDISVNDVNDNPPKFQSSSYSVGVSERDNRGRTLFKLIAEDPDLDDIITYFLLTNTIDATGDNLDEVKDTAFIVDETDGTIFLNFQMQPSMRGFFEFKVQANDLVNHTDEASVKIYLISDVNRVTFVFTNKIDDFMKIRELLAALFSRAYDSECVIDVILESETNGVVQDNLTDVRVHFVRNNEAIDANEILQKSTDIAFAIELNADLLRLNLRLKRLPTETDDSSNENVLNIILIALTSTFGGLLVALIVLYFIQIRSYNRQIKVLTDSSFGSQASDLNIKTKALPNTNEFANKSSNPVMNFLNVPKIDLDTKSIASSDSDDFADLHDNPIFDISQNKTNLNRKNNSTDI